MTILCILPCWGRHEQTKRNAARLITAAGSVDMPVQWVATIPPQDAGLTLDGWEVIHTAKPLTYWHALKYLTDNVQYTHTVNLANDLLPGRDWLARGWRDYQTRFTTRSGLLGFNDGLHESTHSPHFLIARDLLTDFGGWPVWYYHEYGDTELCQRAQACVRYAKSAYAILYHDHPYTGAPMDTEYTDAWAMRRDDMALFQKRKAAGWKS